MDGEGRAILNDRCTPRLTYSRELALFQPLPLININMFNYGTAGAVGAEQFQKPVEAFPPLSYSRHNFRKNWNMFHARSTLVNIIVARRTAAAVRTPAHGTVDATLGLKGPVSLRHETLVGPQGIQAMSRIIRSGRDVMTKLTENCRRLAIDKRHALDGNY